MALENENARRQLGADTKIKNFGIDHNPPSLSAKDTDASAVSITKRIVALSIDELLSRECECRNKGSQCGGVKGSQGGVISFV